MSYAIFVFVILIIIYGPQLWVSNILRKYSDRKYSENCRMTGSQYAFQLIKENSLQNVKVEMNTDKYIIYVLEFPNLNKIYYKNNKRLKDEELDIIAEDLNIINLNPNQIHIFINQMKNFWSWFINILFFLR